MYTFSAISSREQVNFQWDDDEVRFVLDQHAESDFYSASSLKQQSADRHDSLIIASDSRICPDKIDSLKSKLSKR
jgi:hypothetical protein